MTACVMLVIGIWIEKGMGLIIPGFIPSTLHEVVEYSPSLTEWKITAGIWALGLLLLTAMLKVAVSVFSSEPGNAGSSLTARPTHSPSAS